MELENTLDDGQGSKLVSYLEEENDRLQQGLRQKTIEYSELLEKHIILQNSFSETETSIEEVLHCISTMAQSEQSQSQKINILRESLHRKDIKLKSLGEKLAELESKKQASNNECQQLKITLEKLQITLTKSQGDHLKIVGKRDELIEGLRIENKKLSQQVHQISQELSQSKESLAQVRSKWKDQENALSLKLGVTQKKLKQIDSEYQGTRDKLQNCVIELEESKRENATLSDENKRFSARIKDLSDELARHSDHLLSKVKESKDLEMKLIDKEQQMMQSQREMDKLKQLESLETTHVAEIASLKSELVKKSQQPLKHDESVQVNVDSAKIEIYKAQISRLKSDMLKYHALIEQMKQGASVQHVVKEDHENEKKLQKKLSETKNELESLLISTETFVEKERKLLKDLVDKETQICSLQEENHRLMEKLARLPKQHSAPVATKLHTKATNITMEDPKALGGFEGTNDTLLNLDKHIDCFNAQLQAQTSHAQLEDIIKDAISVPPAVDQSVSLIHEEASAMNLQWTLDARISEFSNDKNKR